MNTIGAFGSGDALSTMDEVQQTQRNPLSLSSPRRAICMKGHQRHGAATSDSTSKCLFPSMSSAMDPGGIDVTSTLRSAAHRSFIIDLFARPAMCPGGPPGLRSSCSDALRMRWSASSELHTSLHSTVRTIPNENPSFGMLRSTHSTPPLLRYRRGAARPPGLCARQGWGDVPATLRLCQVPVQRPRAGPPYRAAVHGLSPLRLIMETRTRRARRLGFGVIFGERPDTAQRVRNDGPVRATRPVDGNSGESCTLRFNDWCYWACWSAACWSHFRLQRTQPPTRSLGLRSLTQQVPANPLRSGMRTSLTSLR